VHDANLDFTVWRLGLQPSPLLVDKPVETELNWIGLKQNGLAGSDEIIQLSMANPGYMGVSLASILLGGGVVLS
jgi:hypothetical protein